MKVKAKNRLIEGILWAILPLLAGSLQASRLPPARLFRHLTTAHGLSSNQVNVICRDRQGFIWIGTRDGLNRFDGLEFQIFLPDPQKPGAISDNHITEIYTDRGGSIWVGTVRGGLNRIDSETGVFTCYRSSPRHPGSISSDDITAILEDRQGFLWVGTFDGGLNRLERRTGTFRHFRHDPQDLASLGGDNISSLCQDRTGTLWVGTLNGGLSCLPAGGERFIRFLPHPGDPTTLNDRSVSAVVEDPRGEIWVLTRNQGLNRFNRTDDSFTRIPLESGNFQGRKPAQYYAMAAEPDGRLWIGTSGGIILYDPAAQTVLRIGIERGKTSGFDEPKITSIITAADGVTWVGTEKGGIHYLVRDLAGLTFIQPEPDSPDSSRNTILAIAEDRAGMLWLGSAGGGLIRMERTEGHAAILPLHPGDGGFLEGSIVTAILEDHLGTLWVGTWGRGLAQRPLQSTRFDQIPSEFAMIVKLLEDRRGDIWIGSMEGLFRFERRRNVIRRMMPGFPRALLEDRSGSIWVGLNDNGLCRLDPATGQIDSYRAAMAKLDRLQRANALSLAQTSDGALWVGTEGAGLYRLEPTSGVFTRYGQAEGLPSDTVAAIVPGPAGELWLSFPRFLTRFTPASGIFRTYVFQDRLPGLEFRFGVASQSRGGELFFGGIQGLVAFRPGLEGDSGRVPPVAITAHAFSAVEKRFWAQFAVLDYTSPSQNRYAYKLEGYDLDWIQAVGERKAVYTNLPPGRYTFRVRGAGSGGNWNMQGAHYNFVVPSPGKGRWWLLLLLLPALAVWPLARWLRSRRQSPEPAAGETVFPGFERFLNGCRISAREREIIELIVAGRSNREIEDVLYISMNTVKNHIYHIYRKLGVRSRAQLVGLVERERRKP